MVIKLFFVTDKERLKYEGLIIDFFVSNLNRNVENFMGGI